jgi:hypothetical protein
MVIGSIGAEVVPVGIHVEATPLLASRRVCGPFITNGVLRAKKVPYFV